MHFANPVEFVDQGISPLAAAVAPPNADPRYVYQRASHVYRFGLIDTDAPPPPPNMTYFANTYRTIRVGRTGKLLKKPRIQLIPGAAPGTVAFLDFHPELDDSVYIDYVIVRPDTRRKGAGYLLIVAFYDNIVLPRGIMHVNWGKVMNEYAWAIMKKMQTEYPSVTTVGHVYF